MNAWHPIQELRLTTVTAAFLLVLAGASSANAGATVTTLGGGPLYAGGPAFGFVDGDTKQEAQFNIPSGIAQDGNGALYVADRANGAIRKLEIAANKTTTYIKDLTGKEPVGVAIDRTNVLYVACLGETSILKYDRFNRFTPVASPVGTGLNHPAALALNFDANARLTDIFVVEKGAGGGGALKRIDPMTQASTTVLGGLSDPSGIAILNSGKLILSETAASRLLVVNPSNGTVLDRIGSGAGFADGPFAIARFDHPQQLFSAPNGAVVVADRGNQCVRLVGYNGSVTTLYGVDPLDWGTTYPGWWDGDASVAESREPVGVCVGTNGVVYSTETFYHIVRQTEGAGLASSGQAAGGGTVPEAPILAIISDDPNGTGAKTTNDLSGYYPNGLDIQVTIPSLNHFFNSVIRYTTDGTTPTTNSTAVDMDGGSGVLRWMEPARDLSSLRVAAFYQDVSSPVTSGHSVTNNQIGISRDVQAGVGSTLIVPVVVNLTENSQLRSVQFRVDVTPRTLDTPVILPEYRALSVLGEQFVPFVGFTEPGKTSVFSSFSYLQDRTRRIEVTFIGSNANFYIKQFGVAAFLAVPIPPSAREGQGYSISITSPSGTSDAASEGVKLQAMPAKSILITNVSYLVGDTSPGAWYNAGEFGQGGLDNGDVNNAMYASMGIRQPASYSDAFDAMDAFPMDDLQRGIAGGDGQIRFLDWQTILLRSLGRPEAGEAGKYIRKWNADGKRVVAAQSRSSGMAASLAAESSVLRVQTTADGWSRDAAFGVIAVENAVPGAYADVPIFLNLKPQCSISGMQFRLAVTAQGGAPAVTGPLQFIPAAMIPEPAHVVNFAQNDSSWAWDITAIKPVLKGSNIIGSLRFKVPPFAASSSSYAVHFLNADGAPDLSTQYSFETFPAIVWVLTPARGAASLVSDEWKNRYFGAWANPNADDAADPDGDGIANWQEYQAGTNPIDLLLRITGPESGGANSGAFHLKWYGAEGKNYSLERTENMIGGIWTVLSREAGTGAVREVLDTNAPASTRFYRVTSD